MINNQAQAQQAAQQQALQHPAVQAKMQDPDFMAQFKNMPPEQQQQIMTRLTTDYAGQRDVADEQLATAQALRNTSGPEGRQAGRVFVAANPLEHIGAAYKQRQGAQQYDEALARKKELSEMYGEGIKDVMGSKMGNY